MKNSEIKDSKLSPVQKAHAYALVAWNGLSIEEAAQIASTTPLQELEGKTYASGSIAAAISGIEAFLLKGQQLDFDAVCKGNNEEYYDDFKASIAKMDKTVVYQKIMKILENIHDTWASDEKNAKKHDRDREKGDKRLFQHLPTELIGVDEVAKDLMFLAPILQALGVDVGDIKIVDGYAQFLPTEEIKEAYEIYSTDKIEKSQYSKLAHTSEITPELIDKAIDTYPALKGDEAPYTTRREYMKARLDVLCDQVIKNLDIAPIEPENE